MNALTFWQAIIIAFAAIPTLCIVYLILRYVPEFIYKLFTNNKVK